MKSLNSLINKVVKKKKWHEGVFPLLVQHVPSGCVVLLKDRYVGTAVWSPEGRTPSAGCIWNIRNDSNYSLFKGTIKLTN